MGEAFILRRGGAAARALGAYALICVSLPSGSACVCAKGGERYAVEDAPGLAAFAVTGSGKEHRSVCFHPAPIGGRIRILRKIAVCAISKC